jgi:hypothetical protein
LLRDDPDRSLVRGAVGPATDLALIHQLRGEPAEAERWLGRLEDFRDASLASAPGSKAGHLLAARIASIRGDREAMLDALRAAVERGFRTDWILVKDPVFARWRSERLFLAFVDELRRQNLALRAELSQTREGADLAAKD